MSTDKAPSQEPDLNPETFLRLIKTINYMKGIAERGRGYPCPDDVTPEKFLLDYVKELETAPSQEPSFTDELCGMIQQADDALSAGDKTKALGLVRQLASLASPSYRSFRERKVAPSQEPVATIHVDGSFVHVEWHGAAPNECHMQVFTTPPDVSAQIAELKEKIKSIRSALQIEPEDTETDTADEAASNVKWLNFYANQSRQRKKQIAKLEGMHDHLVEVNADLNKQIAKLEFDLSAEQQENADKREHIAKLEAENKDLQGILQLTAVERDNLKEKLAAAEKGAARLKSDVVKLAHIVMDEYPDGDERYEVAYVAKSLATADEFMDRIDSAISNKQTGRITKLEAIINSKPSLRDEIITDSSDWVKELKELDDL